MTSQFDCQACYFWGIGIKPEDHNMKHTCKLSMETKVESIVEQIHALNDTMGKLAAELEALVSKLAQLPEQKIGDQKPYQKSPEWRILEFVNPKDGSVWIMGNNGYYTHGDSVAFAEHVLLKMIETHDYYIRKVRRNSDGTIWIIGDNVNIAGTSLDGRGLFDVKIKRFNIHGSTMKVVIDSGGYALLSELQKIDQEKKPEYEILEVKDRAGSTHTGFYDSNDAENDMRCKSVLYKLLGQNTNIISVRRLSDGEVFTVGDTVLNCFEVPGTIKDFTYDEASELRAGISTPGCYCGTCIRDLQKPKRKALFTTEDGVEVYYGDKYYFLSKNNWEVHSVNATLKEIGAYDLELKRYVVFSTREAAEEYVKMHQPRYSLDQLRKTFESSRKVVKERYTKPDPNFLYKDFDDYFHEHR